MAASRAHARLHKHKRGSSVSSIGSPRPLSPVADSDAFTFNRSETPRVTYEEPWIAEPTRPKPAAASSSHKIKPYIRKLSAKDNSLDLSRPSENDQLAGLGISDYTQHPLSVSDVNFTSAGARGNRHGRTPSNTSQFSTSSSLQRPTVPYTARPPARPYTPPFSRSTPSSVLGSEAGADDTMTEEEYRLRQHSFDPTRRSGSLSSTPGAVPALRIHTTGSSTHLAGSYSQSSVSLTSPTGQSRPRGDTLQSMNTTTSPSSRTSFDKAFGFIRGGRDSPIDPASRAASIRAAREAFQEKEAAKIRKHDMEAYRQAEKQYKKAEQQQRKVEMQEKKRARSISDSNEKSSRPSIGGRQYSDHRNAYATTLPRPVASVPQERRGVGPKVTKSREAKGRWIRFVTWFKTRLLRMSRRMNCAS